MKESVLISVSLFALRAFGQSGGVQVNHGLVGYGINMDVPACAWACQGVLQSRQLNCPNPTVMNDMAMGSMVMSMTFMTNTSCYATDDSYLQSLALCINEYCRDIPVWQLEQFWITSAVGTSNLQPNPKESYQQALEMAGNSTNMTLIYGDPLNQTSLVANSDYQLFYGTLSTFSWVEIQHEKFGLILVLTGFIIPIFLSFLRFVPFPANLTSFVNSYFIQPPLFGIHHTTPLRYDVGILPTRGQALFIAYWIIINVALSAAGYRSWQPNAKFTDQQAEMTAYIANRLGVLSFANLPLLILYSTRNNILLWITGWSRATFIMLHRWMAYICILEAVLHSAIYLRVYILQGTYYIEIQLPQWIWGVVAALCISFMAPLSLYIIRKRFYEFFLATHVFLVLLTLIGCYLHIWYNFHHQWGYEIWIYTAFAVYGFDRIFRLAKMARNGFRRATVTVLDEDYIRVDIPGVATTGGQAYLCFPSLGSWHFWESHPFSVVATVLLPSKDDHQSEDLENRNGSHNESNDADVSKLSGANLLNQKVVNSSTDPNDSDPRHRVKLSAHPSDPLLGLTFFIRRRHGLTSLLYSRAKSTSIFQLPVLVDSPYPPHPDLVNYPTLICIAGGVGITATLPKLSLHAARGGRTVLYWSVRSVALASQVRDGFLSTLGVRVESHMRVGERFNVADVVRREIERVNQDGNVAVVVCGPNGMADEVRLAVCKIRGRKGEVKFIEERY